MSTIPVQTTLSSKIFLKPAQIASENEHNPLTMSDEQILDQIYTTHDHSNTLKFDSDSLFTLVGNTLRRSINIVDNVVQGSQANLEQIDDKIPLANFSSPLCTLKQISSELSCKPPSEEIAHKTTLAILDKLSNYEWDAKTVLTLAAFALEYGEFWLLAQHQPTDPLAKSVAVLKRVPLLTRPAAVQKHRQAIIEVNNLVKTILQVIELIFELDKQTHYDIKDVPALAPFIEQLPVDVYWAIITVAAVVTQIDCLTTESEQKQELSHYGQKINIILSKLRKQNTLVKKQVDELEYYLKLKKMFQTPTEIVEALKFLIYHKDAPQPLFDGATKTTVDISVLKKKNVFLLISTLEITEEEISVIRPVYDHIKTNEQYKIVWIPIVEEWNVQVSKKFESLKNSVPWYVVQNSGTVAGYKYIKKDWHFETKPIVVVLNHQSNVLNTNAFHLIQAFGIKAFPFKTEPRPPENGENDWFGPIIHNLDSNVDIWIKEQKYIFFYGGNEKEWIQQFTKYATALANDAAIKEAKISIELFCVLEENKTLIKRFWNGIESLFLVRVGKTVDSVTQQVQKLLSYKNETGWALLSKGPSVVLSGHGSTISNAVAEFGNWKELVIKNGFEISFKQYLDKIEKYTHRCSHLEVPIVAGKLGTIKCAECPKTMEIYISYRCCHNETTVNAIH